MNKKLFECSLVAGQINDVMFLSKNRDKKNFGEIKIIHEIDKGVEIAYLHDPTGWVEGMNEFGIGFVYSFLAKEDFSNDEYKMQWWVTATPKTKMTNEYKEKIKDFKNIILSKTVKNAVDAIEKNKWNGNYFVGNANEIWEIECFEGEMRKKKIVFDRNGQYKVKTNHGVLLPLAGHIKGSQNVARASSEIRKIQAEQYLLGFKNYTDVLKRMGQQIFSDRSSLNTFRTDDYERTISQVLLDLKRKIFNFVYYDENSEFFGIDNKLPKNYKSKIEIAVRDKQEFETDEFLRFKEKENDLYFYWQGLKHSKGETHQ